MHSVPLSNFVTKFYLFIYLFTYSFIIIIAVVFILLTVIAIYECVYACPDLIVMFFTVFTFQVAFSRHLYARGIQKLLMRIVVLVNIYMVRQNKVAP